MASGSNPNTAPHRTIELVSDSARRTESIGAVVGAHIQPGDVVALIGELGAGKTQFVRGLAGALGVDPSLVSSPTFVLVHEYPTRRDHPELVHIDAYRIHSADELESIGWSEFVKGPEAEGVAAKKRAEAAVVVEWADRIVDALPTDRLELVLSHLETDERSVTLTAHGSWNRRYDVLMDELINPVQNSPDGQPNDPSKGQTSCPVCGADVSEGEPLFPFCGRRCRSIDLGRWLKGDYKISRPINQADLDED